MQFLAENNLFDTGYNGKKADRCYSVLVQKSPHPPFSKGEKKENSWQSISYREAFREHMEEIISKLSQTRQKLSLLEDDIYGQKEAFLSYFLALENAFSGKEVSKLVELWGEVDIAWMQIT